MKILYFGDFLHPPETKLASVETKIFFKNNVLKDLTFEWDYTCIITELTKSLYDGLVLDLNGIKHGAHSFERQYITRMVLRQIEEKPRVFFVAMNQYTYECLEKESIKKLIDFKNLFVRDEQRDSDIKPLQKFLKVKI